MRLDKIGGNWRDLILACDPVEVWECCDHCGGEGAIEKAQPFHNDPYFWVSETCEECGGAGGHIVEAK